MNRVLPPPFSRLMLRNPSNLRIMILFMIMVFLIAGTLISGCTAPVKDPVIGTWEWSDGKGYTES